MRTFNIFVNGVIVGTVTEDELNAIFRAVGGNWKTWMDQVGSIMESAGRFLKMMTTALVCLSVLAAFVSAYVNPAAVSATLAAMARSPAAIDEFTDAIFTAWVTMCVLMLGVSVFRGEAYGLRDHFALGVAALLRQKLNVAADGAVEWRPQGVTSLSPW